jgi:hypothetical protein
MKATLTFGNVSFSQENAQTINVLLGEEFTMSVDGDETIVWATVGDAITKVEEGQLADRTVKVTATLIGSGEIQVQSPDRSVVYWIALNVYTDEAVSAKVTVNETRTRT